MDSTVLAAIFGAVGAIGGVVIKTFAPELRLLLLGKARTNSDLLGTWQCMWVVAQESGEDKRVTDIVEIEKAWGEEIVATGINTQYGDYKIKGRVSRSSLITLRYEGMKQRQPLGGVLILRLNATRDEMTGRWYEYGREEKIVGGSTVWARKA